MPRRSLAGTRGRNRENATARCRLSVRYYGSDGADPVLDRVRTSRLRPARRFAPGCAAGLPCTTPGQDQRMTPDSRRVVGIDLGTTNSVVATLADDGTVE